MQQNLAQISSCDDSSGSGKSGSSSSSYPSVNSADSSSIQGSANDQYVKIKKKYPMAIKFSGCMCSLPCKIPKIDNFDKVKLSFS